jgi:hypothetical protein
MQMAEENSQKAAHYNERADTLRLMAGEAEKASVRTALNDVADDYDSMARKRERSEPKLGAV